MHINAPRGNGVIGEDAGETVEVTPQSLCGDNPPVTRNFGSHLGQVEFACDVTRQTFQDTAQSSSVW